MTVNEALLYITGELATIYEPGEATAIADLVLEKLTSIVKQERKLSKEINLSDEQQQQLQVWLDRLLKQEPVQYVLEEAWFCGLKFYVDKHTLIPRQETEELVEWIISNCRFPVDELSILDIGSGSGCIPVTLKRRIRKANVRGCDISEDALIVARKNADILGAQVEFMRLDILDQENWDQISMADIIVSNPPYVPISDREKMQPNVVNYEPSLALFVPDEDPLVFYKAIALLGKKKLNAGGNIYFELYEELGNECVELFEAIGYSTELKKDMQGKNRMMKACFK